jgi:putative membrane protein
MKKNKHNENHTRQSNSSELTLNADPSATVRVRNYTPLVIALTILINVLVAVLFFLPEYKGEVAFDLKILPMTNAILNSFTFIFLLSALIAIKMKNISLHRNLILAAFTTTTLFLLSYVTYHFMTESTPFGSEVEWVRYVYFFILITHILLSIVIVPLALTTLARGLNMQVEKHRKIARWTMPLWLYVSATGVIVYLMISPYYQ